MPPPPAPPVDAGSTAPAMAAPSLGGLPEVGGGLSGLGQQLADAFGSLLGSADAASVDPANIEQPNDKVDDIAGASDDHPEKDNEPAQPVPEKPVKEPVVEPADTCEPAETAAAVEPPPTEPAPTPVPVPPPEPAAPLSAEAAAATPCEIAADELPQVGQ
jgi:hypothetical protein